MLLYNLRKEENKPEAIQNIEEFGVSTNWGIIGHVYIETAGTAWKGIRFLRIISMWNQNSRAFMKMLKFL